MLPHVCAADFPVLNAEGGDCPPVIKREALVEGTTLVRAELSGQRELAMSER